MSNDRMMLPATVYLCTTSKTGALSFSEHQVVSDMTTTFIESKRRTAVDEGMTVQEVTKDQFNRRAL